MDVVGKQAFPVFHEESKYFKSNTDYINGEAKFFSANDHNQ